MMIDECFYVNVGELMDRAETLQELPIIHVSGIDGDYIEDNIGGLH